MSQTIKQLEEKNVANEIDLLLWSDRMDLVALSNLKGEVALHRLTWMRTWCFSPYKEGITVKAMAWKPDGKVMAIGYCTGHIVLVNVENKSVLHRIEITGEISCMIWTKEKSEDKTTKATSDRNGQKDYMEYLDRSAIFLPDPPLLSSFSSTNIAEEHKNTNVQKQIELNLLVIGTKDGLIFTSVFGSTPCAVLDLNLHLKMQCSVLSVLLSEDLSLMYVTIKDLQSNVKIVIVGTDIFKSHARELFAIAMKYEYLNSLVNYVSSTITVIKETWENILLEMDAKLSKYASKVPEGTLATDFLDLLMFGITSEQMQEFLLHDLTKKGLEKFGHTIELSYANIQKLLLKNVTKVGQNITYHLAELRGMARLEHRYKILGLNESKISQAVSANGSFLNKSGEMQQIINTSMINYKAFFRWLYTVIMHLIDEQVPSEIPEMTQQDLAYITEFLQNFDDIGPKRSADGTKKNGFIMEKLGQYLIDAPLSIPSNVETNEWNSFLNRNDCIKTHPSIVRHDKETSLVQQFNVLRSSIEKIFDEPKTSLIERFRVKAVIDCGNFPHSVKVTNVNCSSSVLLIVFLSSAPQSKGFYFLELTVDGAITGKGGYVFVPQFTPQDADNFPPIYQILDVQFYTANVLSVLMQDANKSGFMYQCPAAAVRDQLTVVNFGTQTAIQDLSSINASTLGNCLLKSIESMVVYKFAVSGYRKVAVILGDSRRKVRIFEMEAEEEDEEDADMTNSTMRESDTSMHENSDGD